MSANASSEPNLFVNTMPSGRHWIQFLLEGKQSNRSAVGAQVRLKFGETTRLQYVSGGNSFAGQSTARVHFGLADTAKVDQIEVRWPTGQKEVFASVTVGKLNKIVEGTGKKVK